MEKEIMLQFLSEMKSEDLKDILIGKQLVNINDKGNKKCISYFEGSEIFFKNHDGSIYKLDLNKFSDFLLSN
jgi:hypothetical protein